MEIEEPGAPRGWRRACLGEIATFVPGKTPPRAITSFWERAGDRGTPWVTIGDMRPYGLVRNTAERITDTALTQVFRGRFVTRGTLLMSFKLTIGRVATLGVDACHNEAIVAIYPKDEVYQEYLGYFLSQVDYGQYQDRVIKGNTLNRAKIARIEVVLPPIEEQQRVAEVLSRLRLAIETEERVIATARELKQAAMQRLFTRGLRGEEQHETAFGLVPKSWELVPIEQEMRLVTGGTPSRSVPEFWKGGAIPWVKTSEVDYSVIHATEESITTEGLRNSAAKVLPPGTVLLAMYGQGVTRGKVAILGIEAATNQACVGMVRQTGRLEPDFLYYYLTYSYDELRRLSHGAQQQNLSREAVASFRVPRPDLAEQRDMARQLQAIDAKLSVHERKRRTLRDLFKTLLHDLMTGRVRVPDHGSEPRETTGA